MVAIGEAVLIPAGYSMLADLFPPSSRGTAIGLFVMGTTLGNAVSLLVGGGLLHATTRGVLAGLPPMLGFSPWRTTILLISLPGFAMAAVLCTIKEAIRRDRFAGPRASLRHFASLALADHARLTALYLAIALFSMADFGLTVWKPTLFVRHFRLSTGELGLILGTIAAVSSTVGALVGGRVADRGAEPRRRATFAALIGACIAAITVVIAAPNVLLVLSGIAIWSFGWAAVSVIALFGVGLGPTLVAVCTDYLYRDPQLIGWSIVTIMFPAATLGALSLRHVSRHC
jgi:MFS family permease